MSKALRSCNLCKQSEGNMIRGKRIKLGEFNVCDVCREELKNLERVYAEDYEDRTGDVIHMVIPWPAFKSFSWPQYSDVIVSGWQFQKHEFGLGITDNYLLAGRRSIQSYEKIVLNNINDITKEMEETTDYRKRIDLKRKLTTWQKRLESVEKVDRMGERRLPMIPLDFITEMRSEFSPDWIRIRIWYKLYTKSFFGKNKEVRKKDFFTFSRIYEDAYELMEQKVREKGGKVARTQVSEL
jgi:hypothetical protein